MCTVVRDSFINRFWFSAVFRRRVFTGASVHPWKIRKAPIVGANGVKKKKWKEKTMSRGFDRVTDVWQLKIVQLFGAVRIPRRSFRTVLRPFFVFSSIFILPFPSLFFSILHRVAACQLLVTRDPGIEPIVSKLAKSPWKNRALSNPTLSLLVSNLFESKFFLFLFFLLLQFNLFFYYESPVNYLFYVEFERDGRDKF